MHSVAVTARGDLLGVRLDKQQIVLKPGGTVRVDVAIERSPGFTDNVTLNPQFDHLGRVFGQTLPRGVEIDRIHSKTLLTGKESRGFLVFHAAPNVEPLDKALVSVMANVSDQLCDEVDLQQFPADCDDRCRNSACIRPIRRGEISSAPAKGNTLQGVGDCCYHFFRLPIGGRIHPIIELPCSLSRRPVPNEPIARQGHRRQNGARGCDRVGLRRLCRSLMPSSRPDSGPSASTSTKSKVTSLNAGTSYTSSYVDSKVVAKWRKENRFEATADMARLKEADALLICVPTPLNESRDPDLVYVENTARAIAAVLRPGQLVVLESTTYPSTTHATSFCRS